VYLNDTEDNNNYTFGDFPEGIPQVIYWGYAFLSWTWRICYVC